MPGMSAIRFRPAPWAVPLMAACLAAGEARAQPGTMSPEAARFIQSSAHRAAIAEAVRRQSAQLPGRCTDLVLESQFQAIVLAPIHIAADGTTPAAGAWKEQIFVVACGQRKQFNILAAVRPDGALARQALHPGTTIADPLLQRDAVLYANTGALRGAPDACKAFAVVDTAFVAQEPPAPGDPAGKAPWRELWTVDACGTPVAVPLSFRPDATGTVISTTVPPRERVQPR
jgi:hypothetical protein